MLALDAGRVVSADRLIAGIYGDEAPMATPNVLQAHVSRLRRQLGVAGKVVQNHGTGYRLVVNPEQVDAYEFEGVVADSRAALATDPGRMSRQLTEALAMWRGPALADVADSPLVRDSIARFEELRLVSHELLAEADIARGAAASVVPRLRELVTAHPVRESSWQLLIRALAETGRRAEALVAFEDVRALLADELGADPSPELSAVHLRLLREEVEISQTPSRARELPTPLTRLIGREDELALVASLLTEHRLVSLVGTGGSGKTRLAIEAARRSELRVFFAELAAVEDPGDVRATVGSALGLRSYDAPDEVLQRLVNVLASGPALLLLDNCEHVADQVARLTAELLVRCPSLRILITSREPLGVTGEALCPIPTLGVPPEGVDSDTAMRYPAVRLFADRVGHSQPGFTVDETNGESVIAICRTLDGMPLAIELAAVRARTLSLQQIADRLDDPFALLSRGDRTKDPRHRTLRAVVGWSWELLSEAERDLACRLSVFSGGATMDAVREVCGLGSVEDLLASLVDKSFVELRDGRYRMLEPIRAYAAERLAEAGQTTIWQREHARYFLHLAEEAEVRLRTGEQLVWLRRLDADDANVRSALHWAADSDIVLALRLIGALSTYWWIRGLKHEAARMGRLVTQKVGTAPPDGMAEEYLLAVFDAAVDITDPQTLSSRLGEVDELTRDWTLPARRPILPVLWAWLAGPVPSHRNALRSPTNALLDSDPWGRALRALSDGLLQLHRGEPRLAERNLTRAVERFRALGERWGLFQAVQEVSLLCSWRGEYDRAVVLINEAIRLAGDLEAMEDLAELFSQRARYWMNAGDLDRAGADVHSALEVARRTGAPGAIARARAMAADLERLDGDLAAADGSARLALRQCPTGWLRPAEERLQVLLVLGRVELAKGELDPAAGRYLEILQTADPVPAAAAMTGLAGVAVARDDGALGAGLLGAADAVRGCALTGDPEVDRISHTARRLAGEAVVAREYAAARAMTESEARRRVTGAWLPRLRPDRIG